MNKVMLKKYFFILSFLLILSQAWAHKATKQPLETLQTAVHSQSFEAIPNYLGEPYLISDLVANFEMGTTEVIMAVSYDGKTWKAVDREALHFFNRSSYENTLIHFEGAHLADILKKMEGEEVHFRTYYKHNGQMQDLTRHTIAKKTLLQWYKQAKRSI